MESRARKGAAGWERVTQGRGDVIGECKHEENFLSSWLRGDGKEKEEIIMEIGKGDQRRDGQNR